MKNDWRQGDDSFRGFSILLGSLSSRNPLVSIWTRPAGFLFALAGAVRLGGVGMIVVAWAILVVVLVATTVCRLGPAGVGLTIRVGRRGRGRVFIRGFTGLAWFVVNTAYCYRVSVDRNTTLRIRVTHLLNSSFPCLHCQSHLRPTECDGVRKVRPRP